MEKLLEKKHKKKYKATNSSNRGKKKKGPIPFESSNNDGFVSPDTPPKLKKKSNDGIDCSSKTSKLEKWLESVPNQNSLQEAGVTWSYPAKWDMVPYPSKFKAPTLQAFDGIRSPDQHIYYFKS